MNKLALTLRLCKEAGIPTASVTTTVGATGELARVVSWIETAYEEIQNAHPVEWRFLREDFAFTTVVSTANYTEATITADITNTLSDLNVWKSDSFRCYLTSTGVNDEQWIQFIPWDEFRDTRLMGPNSAVSGRPIEFTVKPDNSITLWPIPDDIYSIVGEYFKTPQTMSGDSSFPVFPTHHHMTIVWHGLMSYGAYESAVESFQYGEKKFTETMSKLEIDQLPGLCGWDALA